MTSPDPTQNFGISDRSTPRWKSQRNCQPGHHPLVVTHLSIILLAGRILLILSIGSLVYAANEW